MSHRLIPEPSSLVLCVVDDRSAEVTDELLFEAILFRAERRAKVWRGDGYIAVLRDEDELDAILWAGQVSDRLRESGIRLSAGVATTRHGRLDLLARAEHALERARYHGGAMVLAWTTTAAVRDTRTALRRSA